MVGLKREESAVHFIRLFCSPILWPSVWLIYAALYGRIKGKEKTWKNWLEIDKKGRKKMMSDERNAEFSSGRKNGALSANPINSLKLVKYFTIVKEQSVLRRH